MKLRIVNSQTLSEIQEVDLLLATRLTGECVIGRSPNCNLVLDSPDVSRLHGKFSFENGNYYFCDFGSRNGSILNGQLAQTNYNYQLKSGDIIRIGEFMLALEEVAPILEEDLAETVYGNINNATVISDWREMIPKLGTPGETISESEEVEAQEVSEKPSVELPSVEVKSEYTEATSIQGESTFVQTSPPEEVSSVVAESVEAESYTSEATYILSPEPVNVVEISENISQIPLSEEVSSVVAESVEAESYTSEATYILSPEPANVVEISENISQEVELEEQTVVVEENIAQPVELEEEVVVAESNISQPVELEEQTVVVEENIAQPVELEEEVVVAESNISQPVELEEQTVVEESNISQLVDLEEQPVVEENINQEVEETADTESNEVFVATKEIPEIFKTKYIVLISHDSKRWELSQFVGKHQDFLAKCLTIAPSTVSDSLQQQFAFSVSQQIPAPTSGGYQNVASKVANGDVLAVIFLRDLMMPQSGQINEEALLRLCTINDILVATNMSTAEAILHYISHM